MDCVRPGLLKIKETRFKEALSFIHLSSIGGPFQSPFRGGCTAWTMRAAQPDPWGWGGEGFTAIIRVQYKPRVSYPRSLQSGMRFLKNALRVCSCRTLGIPSEAL